VTGAFLQYPHLYSPYLDSAVWVHFRSAALHGLLALSAMILRCKYLPTMAGEQRHRASRSALALQLKSCQKSATAPTVRGCPWEELVMPAWIDLRLERLVTSVDVVGVYPACS